ncbi:MAG: hypothetical protein AAF558_15545, partial [Verrucomicrobiota bacterium]
SDLTEYDLHRLASIHRTLEQSIIKRLIVGTTKGSAAESVIQDLKINYQTSALLPSLPFGNDKILLLDDIHKLCEENATILSRLITEIVEHETNTSVICAYRSKEFCNVDLELVLSTSIIAKFELEEMSPTEVQKAICGAVGTEFKLPKDILDAGSISTLSLCRFLQSFRTHNIPKRVPEAIAEIRALISDEGFFDPFPESSTKIINKNFLAVGVVFAVRSGIPKSWLAELISEDELEKLLDEKIFRIDHASEVFPHHDIVADRYIEIFGSPYTDETGHWIEERLSKNPERASELLSILIRCGSKFQKSYFEIGEKTVREELARRDYRSALRVLSAMVGLFEDSALLAAKMSYSKQVWILHHYAMCLDHCEGASSAHHYYRLASSTAEDLIAKPEERAVGYEAESEIFNFKFWHLKTAKTRTEIASFITKLARLGEGFPNLLHNDHFIKAVLNAHNRAMAISFLEDRVDEANEYFRKSLELSGSYSKENYAGYAKMDKARGLLLTSVDKSLQLLEEALKCFILLNTEARRASVCEVDIALASIQSGIGRLDTLVDTVSSLKSLGYFSEYRKGLLKVAAASVASGNIEMAKEFVTRFNHENHEFENPRVFGLLANIRGAISSWEGDKDSTRYEAKEHSRQFKGAGRSYLQIAERNAMQKLQSGDVCWANQPREGAYYLEPRLW